MNKNRLEALSDGVFAIVMTLLVIEIHVPELIDPSSADLWHGLVHLAPLFASYVVSFTVLMMYWTSHHAMYHMFLKNVDRTLVQLNGLYLMSLSLIPFSSHFVGSYPTQPFAIALYGGHIVIQGVIAYIILKYVLSSKQLEKHDISSRTIAQARIRAIITPAFACLGVLAGFTPLYWLSYVLFMFPVIFNLIPGSLNWTERKLGITIS